MDFNNLDFEVQKTVIDEIITKLKLPPNYYITTEVVLKSYSNFLSAFGLMDLEFEDEPSDSNTSNDLNADSISHQPVNNRKPFKKNAGVL